LTPGAGTGNFISNNLLLAAELTFGGPPQALAGSNQGWGTNCPVATYLHVHVARYVT